MTNPDSSRHIEVSDGGEPVAAEVTTSAGADGTVRASLHAPAGHITPGSRASLVDAVMDLPEVQASARMEAAVPLGDDESLERLRERTENAVTRSAGSTALLDADIPSGSRPGPGQDPDGGTTPRPMLHVLATGAWETGDAAAIDVPRLHPAVAKMLSLLGVDRILTVRDPVSAARTSTGGR